MEQREVQHGEWIVAMKKLFDAIGQRAVWTYKTTELCMCMDSMA